MARFSPPAPHHERVTGYQLEHPHRPDVIVAPTDPAGVRNAVRVACDRNVPVSVQSSGHGRRAPLVGGVLIDTGELTEIHVDGAAGSAWVGAGVRWHHLTQAGGVDGLLALSGSHPDVSVVGYTLAGGLGALARWHGHAADHVRRLELVTPDGEALTVTTDTEPDLFWALRGGGGAVNLGIVTSMEVELAAPCPLSGGNVMFAAAPELVEGYLEWTRTLTDRTTTSLSMLTFPDMPGMPDDLRGRHVASVRVLHAGDAPLDQVTAPLLELAQPLHSSFSPMKFSDIFEVFDEPREPHGYLGDERTVRHIPRAAIDELIAATSPASETFSVAGIRHLGGALRREPSVPNAIPRTAADFSVGVLSMIESFDDRFAADTIQGRVMAALEAEVVGRSLQFRFGRPVDDAAGRAAFTDTGWHRLKAIASAVDPVGKFAGVEM